MTDAQLTEWVSGGRSCHVGGVDKYPCSPSLVVSACCHLDIDAMIAGVWLARLDILQTEYKALCGVWR